VGGLVLSEADVDVVRKGFDGGAGTEALARAPTMAASSGSKWATLKSTAR